MLRATLFCELFMKHFLNMHQWQIWSCLSSCVRNGLDWCSFSTSDFLMNMAHDLSTNSALLPQIFQSDLPPLQLSQHRFARDRSLTSLPLAASQGVRVHGTRRVLIISEVTYLSDISLLPRFTGISSTITGVRKSPSQELVNHFFCSSR